MTNRSFLAIATPATAAVRQIGCQKHHVWKFDVLYLRVRFVRSVFDCRRGSRLGQGDHRQGRNDVDDRGRNDSVGETERIDRQSRRLRSEIVEVKHVEGNRKPGTGAMHQATSTGRRVVGNPGANSPLLPGN